MITKPVRIPDGDTVTWKTKDGKELLMSEMADSHLINAHALVRSRIVTYLALSKELKKRKLTPRPPEVGRVPARLPIDRVLDQWAKDMEEIGFSAEDVQDFL